MTAKLIGGFALACLAASALDYTRPKVCGVDVQDRRWQPAPAPGSSEVLRGVAELEGVDFVPIPFGLPENVDRVAIEARCTHIVYTDLARLGETGKSRARRAVRRDALPEFEAEFEYRVFRPNAEAPLLSRWVKGRSGPATEAPPEPATESCTFAGDGEADSEPAAVPTRLDRKVAAVRAALTAQMKTVRSLTSGTNMK